MKTGQLEQVSETTFVGIPYPFDGAMAAVVGEELTLVVDGTSYPLFAEQFVSEVEQRADRRRRVLVLTHRHFDHFAGLAAFEEPILAPRLTREVLEEYDSTWLEQNVGQWLEHGLLKPELLGDPRVRLPQLQFEGPMRIDLGGTVAELIPVGGHVPDIAVVYLPDEEVLIASDAVGNGRDLFLDESDADDWIAALERLSERAVTTVVPGHGPIGGRDLLRQQLDTLQEHRRSHPGGQE